MLLLTLMLGCLIAAPWWYWVAWVFILLVRMESRKEK